MDNFGGFAKLKEIITVSGKERVPDAMTLAQLLLGSARRTRSGSPFRRPIANDNRGSKFLPLELETIHRHVKFADRLGLVTFRSADQSYLPGLEPSSQEYSEEMVDAKIVKFLANHGISMNRLAATIDSIDFRDIDSIADELLSANGRMITEGDFKKCIRLLGDCGVSLQFSRKKTYAMRSSS